jgi:hypothetical protein
MLSNGVLKPDQHQQQLVGQLALLLQQLQEYSGQVVQYKTARAAYEVGGAKGKGGSKVQHQHQLIALCTCMQYLAHTRQRSEVLLFKWVCSNCQIHSVVR